jgi:DNA-binding MarR family transcriptional regulator
VLEDHNECLTVRRLDQCKSGTDLHFLVAIKQGRLGTRSPSNMRAEWSVCATVSAARAFTRYSTHCVPALEMKSIVSPVPVEESTAAALSQSIHRLSRRLRKHAQMDLTASQMGVLTTVEKHGVLRLGELTRVEQVGKSTMTRLVAKLAGAGYLERLVDPSDGRGSLVSLTDHGAAALRSAAARQLAYLGRQLDALDAADRDMLLAVAPILEKLLAVKA